MTAEGVGTCVLRKAGEERGERANTANAAQILYCRGGGASRSCGGWAGLLPLRGCTGNGARKGMERQRTNAGGAGMARGGRPCGGHGMAHENGTDRLPCPFRVPKGACAPQSRLAGVLEVQQRDGNGGNAGKEENEIHDRLLALFVQEFSSRLQAIAERRAACKFRELP